MTQRDQDRELAGEFVARATALYMAAKARRPALAGVGGPVVVTLDAGARTIVLGQVQQSGEVVIIERLHADPANWSTFGESDLPVYDAMAAPVRH